jgi:hypothetical protein
MNENSSLNKNTDWIFEEFQSSNFGDKRLSTRLCLIAKGFYNNVGASIPQNSTNWTGAKGTYRFFDNNKVMSEKILEPHTTSTLKRIGDNKIILAIQDTTLLDYSTHVSTSGIGAIGDGHGRGLYLHPTIATSCTGIPLGILNLQIWSHDEEYYKKRKGISRKKVPLEDRDSYKWIKSYKSLVEHQKTIENKVHFVSICDREGDIYELFHEHFKMSQTMEFPPDVLVRAKNNRKLSTKSQCLWDFMEQIEIHAEYEIIVPRKKGQKERRTNLEVKFSEVEIKSPLGRPLSDGKLPDLKLYAIYCNESDKTLIKAEDSISWMLLTTMPIYNFEDAQEKINWYVNRWLIERFFKCLKSGCKTESRQLKDIHRLKSVIILDCIIAWRVLFLILIGRENLELKADILFKKEEWEVLHIRIQDRDSPPNEIPHLKTVLIQIAKLGGFLARKGDGFPGEATLTRGLRKLQELTLFYSLIKEKDKGNV